MAGVGIQHGIPDLVSHYRIYNYCLFIPFRSFAVWLVFRAVGAPTVRTVSNKTASRSYNSSATVHDCGKIKTSSRTPPSYPALVPYPFLKNQIVDSAKERRLTSCGRLMKEDKSLR